ncbi:MAG: hypothetical protein ORO03_01585, partial [Alphaproteobacteria bacterium]|nr:hypothetical protein [Alphaproteobacteria bacterium]
IEGVGVAVINTASAFSGSLALVSNGQGIDFLSVGNNQQRQKSIGIVAGLTVGAVNDGRSDLLLQQRAPHAQTAIEIFAPVTVGRDLTVLAESSSGQHGIFIKTYSVTVGRNLTLVKHGNFGVAITIGGISLESVTISAGGTVSLVQTAGVGVGAIGIGVINISQTVSISAAQGISFKTANAKLTLISHTVLITASLTSPRVRLDLGSAPISSIDGQGEVATTPGNTMNALGADVYLTSATSGNNATIAVGSGSFTLVNDKRTATAPVEITNTTTASEATNGWGAAPTYGAFANGSTSLGGLTISGTGGQTSLQGLGVVYGGNVKISGMTTGTGKDLRYIQGNGVAVTGVSRFSGSLMLVSSGGEVNKDITFSIDGSTNTTQNRIATMLITSTLSAGLSTAEVSDGVSRLTLVARGVTTGNGIFMSDAVCAGAGELAIFQSGASDGSGFIAYSSTLKSGGDVSLVQSGFAKADGISLNRTSLEAGGNLSVIQAGTIDPVYRGIALSAFGTGTGTRRPMSFGSSSWAQFKTNHRNLVLSGGDNFYLTGGSMIRLDLGTGVIASGNLGPGVIPGGLVLHAEGSQVYFTGATSGNSATVAIGTGGFTYVTDLRSAVTTTVGNSPLALASFSAGATSGLTVTGSNTTIKTGIVGALVTIDGLNEGANQGLSYIEGNGITVTGAASVFNGDIILRAVNGGSLALGGNLSAGGDLKLYASGMSLTSHVTTAGGNVTIDLGKAGVYDNGTGNGFTLNTSEQNLKITAGKVSNLTPSNAIFRLGNGQLSVGGGLTRATQTRTGTPSYNGGYITTDTQHNAFISPNAIYYFATDVAAARTELASTANAFVLSADALTAADLRSQTIGSYSDSFTSTGFTYRAVGEIFWGQSGGTYASTGFTHSYRLANGHAVHFYKLSNPSLPATPPSWLAKSASLTFDGANIFATPVTIASAGAITQATGSTLTVGANSRLSITSSSEIIL